jgi:hypothetical protein
VLAALILLFAAEPRRGRKRLHRQRLPRISPLLGLWADKIGLAADKYTA